MMRIMTLYEANCAFEELMDKALNELPPNQFKKFMDDIIKMLADYEYEGNAPTVEPKQGEWIYHRPPDDWIMSLYSCSECGHIEEGKPNFCPNCGARMKIKETDQHNE